jgi:2-C-methyl-D-erythritol 4-phosphate cytidylyltransferase / 2-C-methyl-D-erythritol 2,4-cyclodiphosphate synthase
MTSRAGAVILADRELHSPFRGPSGVNRLLDYLLRICTLTVDACPQIDGFVVIAAPGVNAKALYSARASAKFLAMVPSGSTTRDSVGQAVEALSPEIDRVVIHDVARPMASAELFARAVQALDASDAVVPQVPVSDTVKRVERDFVRETIPRQSLAMVQTPQGFRREVLVATERADDGNADRLSELLWALQAAGLRVVTIPGDPANIRVGDPGGLRLVEALLARREARTRGR